VLFESLNANDLAEKLFKVVRDLDDGGGGQLGTQAMIRAYLD
jgi:3-hydroxyisobutyrate dehydrogenase